jgi:hypothetical protein
MNEGLGVKDGLGEGVEKSFVMRCCKGPRASQQPRARARGSCSVESDVPRGIIPRICSHLSAHLSPFSRPPRLIDIQLLHRNFNLRYS